MQKPRSLYQVHHMGLAGCLWWQRDAGAKLQYMQRISAGGREGNMIKRILTNTYRKQFVIIPTFGIIRWTENYRFRIGFLWGIWQLSIGVFREEGP